MMLALSITFLQSEAQPVNSSYYAADTVGNLHPGDWALAVSNNNFLKNNEYFDLFSEGFTYFGSTIQPMIRYAPVKQLLVTAGWHFRYYYGTGKFNVSLPVIRVDYHPEARACVTFGQIDGQLNHALIEPIYGSDQYFERKPEYGLQFRWNSRRLKSDTWISWDRFILPGDPFKEEITGGINTTYDLLQFSEVKDHQLSLNVQGVVHHYGGQVDASGSPLETRYNLAPGLIYTQQFKANLQASAGTWFIQAVDPSGQVTIPYKKGFGSYTLATLKYHWAQLHAGYFHGEYYFSPLGDPQFQSVSTLNPWYYKDKRDILFGKLLFDKVSGKSMHLGFRFETYYDLAESHLNFCYGLNIRTSFSSLLKAGGKRVK